jgi:hypothetical protein
VLKIIWLPPPTSSNAVGLSIPSKPFFLKRTIASWMAALGFPRQLAICVPRSPSSVTYSLSCMNVSRSPEVPMSTANIGPGTVILCYWKQKFDVKRESFNPLFGP